MSKKVRSSSTKGKTEEKAAPPPTKKSGAEPVILASGNYEINQVGFDDMTKMDDMTLDAVLENLKDRYAVDTIYTFTATILTAINPYKNLPIYDLRFVKRYKGVRLGILAPHVFSVAEQAYNDMIERKKNQSVLVSGESGAGKTMSTKYILRYLSDRTGKQSKIDEMVIASVPILEALGNAKTLRNDNSSRFGKFIEVQFDEDYTIAGSKTIPYLLEKSRITNHQNGERDFHIFYQLTEGMPKERQKLFKLGPATQFKYLVKTPDQAKFITIDGVDDAKEFQDFEKALEIFEVYEEVRNNIYRVISAVLWFGNVEYKAIGDKAALKDAESEQALKNAAELLSVDYEKLQWGLTNKKIKAMKEVIDKPLTATEAKDMTDAVAKHIYSVLFEWLVEILNAGTACEHYISFIGVLDIFGFEVFELNSMEQFLINYTNERLQQFFNHYIFKLEQAEYEREQIDWTVIQFKDNQDTLDLIESKRPPGIISLLDEESKFPKATDDSLIEKLHTNLDKNPLYGKPRLQRRKFSVKHYAGVVEYEVSGWRDRNRDELPPLLVEALQGSNNQFMAILFTEDDEDRLLPVLMEREKRAFDEVGDGKEASPKANRRISFARGGGSALRKNAAGQEKKAAAEQGSAATKITLATQFKQQLLDLMTMLGSTDPFFIRCIKPNEHKKQDDFDQELIYNQLLYAGMLETIRIRRMGYPVRYIHRDFWKRFRVICPEVNPIDDMKQLSKNLAIALGLNIPGETQVGLTKVVLKQHTPNELEDRRAIALTSTIIKMQTWWRWAFYRSKFINDRENAILLEAWWRYTRKRKVFLRQRRGACSIGQWWRMVQAIKAKKKLAEEKRKKEEEKRRKEEEARKKRIEKYGLDQVLAEEEAERKGEIDKLRELAAGAVPKEKKKKKKKKTRLERSSSIIMEKMEEVEIPINVDSKIVLGLGWKGRTAGLDASVIIFRYQQHRDDVYYYKPRSNDGAIMHRGGYQGMIRRGLEEGQTNDAEQIEINLNKVTPKANTIIVVVTVFDGDFSSTTDAYIRLLDDASGHEYARFTLQDAGSETARIMCKLTRQGHTRWRLKALGEPSQGRVFKHMIAKVRPFLDEEPPKTKMTINVKEGEFKLRQTESRRRPTKSYKQLALYAEVYYDTEKEKTKSVKASPDKTMKPKWDQQRVLTGCSNYIEVAIFNNRGRFGGGQFLGRVVIDLGEKGEANDEWFDVEKPDEGVRSTYVEGKLRLSYSRV